MLRSLKELDRFTVQASDGDIGSVEHFLLDDGRWVIRYLVVDTVEFLDGRQVLISPISFGQIEWDSRRFHLSLAMAQIASCPGTEKDQPVSRQHEDDLNQHYGYLPYWAYSGLWGMGDNPAMIAAKRESVAAARAVALTEDRTSDSHLRSTSELRGYHIQGTDEAIGHVDDFIFDEETWQVRYLVIDTSNWWFGKKVLIPPQWASHISWEEARVDIEMSREAIQSAPEWNSEAALTRDYEISLFHHFHRPGYWGPAAPPTGRR